MRHALRSLSKARGFAVAAIGIVAVGIGASTAVFSIVDAVIVRPLPFKEAGRVFVMSGFNPKRGVDGAFFS